MRRYVYVLVALCLSASAPTLLRAQPPAPPTSGAKAPAAPEAAYSFERLYTRARFESDGTGQRELTVWVKVLDEQAVREFGEIPFFYQSDSEDLAVPKIEVQKVDGTIAPTTAAGVQDLAVRPAGGAPVFVDLREKVISVSALRPGDTVKVTAVWTTKSPIAPGQFWFEYSFNQKDTVRDEQLEIDVPAQRAVAMKIRAGAPAEERGGTGSVAGDRHVYRWKTSHLGAATNDSKPHTGDDPPPDVRLSSFRNWNEFGAWFGPLGSAAPDAEIAAKAAALTAGAADEAAKVAGIYRFVSTEIRYVSLSFGLGRYAAHKPADVLKNQYGDCKDKAVLLQALLSAAGVRSAPVLLNTKRSIGEDFASPLEFDHMIAIVPRGAQAGDGTWMDATVEVAPLGMLIAPTRNKLALVIDRANHASVVRTPVDPPFPSVDRLDITGKTNAIGVLTATVTYALRGDSEIAARSIVRGIPRSALKDFVTALAATNGLAGDLSNFSTSDPASTVEPFQVTFELRKPRFLDWAASHSEMETLPTIAFEGSKSEEREGLDRMPVGSSRTVVLHASIELPMGYEADAPVALSASSAGFVYTADYRVEARQAIVNRQLKVTGPDIPASQFAEYTSLAGAAAKDFEQHFKVRGGVAETPTPPADATAPELYQAGNSAYDAKRYDAAIALWKRGAELDPKDGNTWIALGLAYGWLKKYDEAADAIRKQITLDPMNKRAYSDLGWVLKGAGKKEEAAKAYARHVEINPLDGDALAELGKLYTDLDRYADALGPLSKAASLIKPDAWVFADLGSAHLHAKQTDQARRAFDRAIDVSPTPAILAKISWQLAEAGVDLDRAVDLAARAEKGIAEKTQNLTLPALTQDHLDLMERLAWAWDAHGWADFQQGKLPEAEAYVHAAWRMLGRWEISFHLGQIYEKETHLADALSYYLTAQALATNPPASVMTHIKHLSGGGDLKLMLASAKIMAPAERVFRIRDKALAGTAQFLAIVGNDGKVLDVSFAGGTEVLRSLIPALRGITYPIDIPGNSPGRVAIGVRVKCDEQHGCGGGVAYPSQVELNKNK